MDLKKRINHVKMRLSGKKGAIAPPKDGLRLMEQGAARAACPKLKIPLGAPRSMSANTRG